MSGLKNNVFLYNANDLFFHYNTVDIMPQSIEIIIDNESIYNMAIDVTLVQYEEYIYFMQYINYRTQMFRTQTSKSQRNIIGRSVFDMSGMVQDGKICVKVDQKL